VFLLVVVGLPVAISLFGLGKTVVEGIAWRRRFARGKKR
jgi:hypothetical protein